MGRRTTRSSERSTGHSRPADHRQVYHGRSENISLEPCSGSLQLQKAYDKVHHDWMLRVYNWTGIPGHVIRLLSDLMRKWKTIPEIWSDGKKKISRWIKIKCGFLQGDSYSPDGLCLSEIPVCQLPQESKGYQMGEPGNREIKLTHSLFVYDLKVYQESHKNLKDVNEIIVEAMS